MPDLTRHSSATPVPAAAHQSFSCKNFRSAMTSQVLFQIRVQRAGQRLLPAALPRPPPGPIAASTAACEPHSLTVTTRTFGNTAGPAAPARDPKKARLALLSGHPSVPSSAISRHGPRNAPAVSRPATGTATWLNSSASGSGPSRLRAWVIPPDVGTSHSSSQQPHPRSVSVSRAATSS